MHPDHLAFSQTTPFSRQFTVDNLLALLDAIDNEDRDAALEEIYLTHLSTAEWANNESDDGFSATRYTAGCHSRVRS